MIRGTEKPPKGAHGNHREAAIQLAKPEVRKRLSADCADEGKGQMKAREPRKEKGNTNLR
jgi:hypothetical protein